MICALCGKDYDRLARSHIIPWGFFNHEEWGHDLTSYSSSGDGRRLKKALYDESICCDDCEHRILAPFDDYAVRIYRDFRRSQTVALKGVASGDWNFIVFDGGIDRRKLRGFFASLLWRCSVSHVKELASFDIGKTYLRRIADDLLNDGDFCYLDSICFSLTAFEHQGIILPYRTRFNRNGRVANGYVVQLPHLEFKITLDQRPNPYDFGTFDLESIEQSGVGSMSIAQTSLETKLLIFQAEKMEHQWSTMVETYHNYVASSKIGRKP